MYDGEWCAVCCSDGPPRAVAPWIGSANGIRADCPLFLLQIVHSCCVSSLLSSSLSTISRPRLSAPLLLSFYSHTSSLTSSMSLNRSSIPQTRLRTYRTTVRRGRRPPSTWSGSSQLVISESFSRSNLMIWIGCSSIFCTTTRPLSRLPVNQPYYIPRP
jgi:hypothetical protein